MATLQEQTSDPRWQRKRLEVMDRDEWACKQCGDTETTLTVHHKSYRMKDGKFVDYWDYGNQELITLCNKCHEVEENNLNDIKKDVFFKLRHIFDTAMDIDFFVSRLNNMRNDCGRLQSEDALIVPTKPRDKEHLEQIMVDVRSVLEGGNV